MFYMDDLKTFAKGENQLIGLLTIIKTFSDDIKMEVGLDNCAKATFKRGRLDQDQRLRTWYRRQDQGGRSRGHHKYLGVNEADAIQHSAMKEKIRKE